MFYVYAYLDPRKPGKFQYGELIFEFEPFYIGKGKGIRIKSHKSEVHNKGCGPLKINKLKAIYSSGLQPVEVIIEDNLQEEVAFNKEIYWIHKIGRQDLNVGPLCNMTDGGDGKSNPSLESRLKLSLALKGRKRVLLPETRARISTAVSLANKTRIMSKELKDRLSQINSTRMKTDKNPMKNSTIARNKQNGPKVGTKYNLTEEQRLKRRQWIQQINLKRESQ